jgi:hypothetical protein
MKPTIIYEDNSSYITQMNAGYIKSNIRKHIAPKLFLQTKSCDNLANLFIKSLPTSLFQKYIFGIGTRRLKYLQASGGVNL